MTACPKITLEMVMPHFKLHPIRFLCVFYLSKICLNQICFCVYAWFIYIYTKTERKMYCVKLSVVYIEKTVILGIYFGLLASFHCTSVLPICASGLPICASGLSICAAGLPICASGPFPSYNCTHVIGLYAIRPLITMHLYRHHISIYTQLNIN